MSRAITKRIARLRDLNPDGLRALVAQIRSRRQRRALWIWWRRWSGLGLPRQQRASFARLMREHVGRHGWLRLLTRKERRLYRKRSLAWPA